MREYSVPALVEVDERSNLTQLVVDNAVQTPHKAVLTRKVAARWQDVTAREFLAEVSGLAKGLMAAGIGPGDRVGLMSKTRYEWTLADFAIWFAGAVTVPIYETSSAEQVSWILADSGAVAVFVETAEHAAVVAEVRGSLPGVRDVWQLEKGAVEELTEAGAQTSDEALEDRRREADLSSLATIIYTSGTTGRPKGCELTHGNFVHLSKNTAARLLEVVESRDSATLLFLPLAHVFARFIQVLCVATGARMGYTADVKHLIEDLSSYSPTFILSVPRVFEKIYNGSEQKAIAAGKGRIFAAAAATAIGYSQALDTGGAGLALRLRHALFDRLVYAKLRRALGGRLRYAVSGGAPLGVRLGHFYRGIGLVVLEGYGLTETTAPSTVTTPDQMRIGTVGPPLPGGAIRIDDDGEILIRGLHVFRGYWNNPGATAESLRDGWFSSGDLGDLDDDGFLRITGRKKEILVTASGKNVAPAVLEDRLRAHPLVSQCMVVGDQKPFVACLITLDPDMLPTWLANHGRPGAPPADLASDPEIREELQRAVDDANRAVSQAEAIRKFTILPVDFTEEGGYLTPSLKLKRNVVMKDFSAEVDKLYS